MDKKSIVNAIRYTWGENCNGWHLLQTSALSVIEETMPAGTSEKKHLHYHAQQVFYILEGVAHFQLDDKEIILAKNETIYVKENTAHFISNKNETMLRFLIISAPMSHGDRQDL